MLPDVLGQMIADKAFLDIVVACCISRYCCRPFVVLLPLAPDQVQESLSHSQHLGFA